MERILAIDYGDSKVGLAVNDELNITAIPIITVFYKGDREYLFSELEKYIKQYNISKIVVGMPKNMNGTIGPQAEYCLKFKEMLEEATKLEVVMIDERLTSKQADVYMLSADLSRQKRKKNVDKLAAAIILQTYLDRF